MANPFDYLDGLNADQLKQRLAQIQSERQRRAADRATYQQLRSGQDQAALPAAVASNIGKVATDQAMQGAPTPDFLKMLNSTMATPSPEEMARIQSLADQTGATSLSQPGANISPDIEEAKRAPGAHEIVSGDQRLVLDAQGNPLATRSEFPSLREHVRAYLHGEPNAASLIGLVGNAFESALRPEATAANYALAGNPDLTKLPGDLAGAVAGTSGSSGTVSEGGMVAKRGGGWGDVLRAQLARMKGSVIGSVGADNPALDKLGPGVAGGLASIAGPLGVLYAGTKARNAINQAGPQHEATLGDLLASIGMPSEYLDDVIKGYAKTKHSAQLAMASGLSSAGLAGRYLAKTPLGMLFDATAPTGVAPEYAADPVKQTTDALLGQFGMGRKLSTIGNEDPALDAWGQLAATVYDPLNVLPVEKAPEAAFSALEKVGVPGAGLARRAVTADLTKLASRESSLERGLTKDALKGGATPEQAAAEASKVSSRVYDEAQRVHAESQVENNMQQRLIEEARGASDKADQPLVRQLLEGPIETRLRDKPDLVQLADIRAEADRIGFNGLSTEEEALVKSIPPDLVQKPEGLRQVAPAVFFRRQRLADKLGVDLTAEHPWARSTNPAEARALVSARSYRRALARNLEEDQRLGLLPHHLRPEGFMPHAPRSPVATALTKMGVPDAVTNTVERAVSPFMDRLTYNPRKPREMAALGDTEVLRRAANVVVRNADETGAQVSHLLRRFANGEEIAPAGHAWVQGAPTEPPRLVRTSGPVMGDRGTKAAREWVRRELLQEHNVRVWAPSNTVEEAQRLAENRVATGSGKRVSVPVGFEQDPGRAVAAYRNAAAPAQQGAAFSDAIAKMRDANGDPLFKDLDEAITKPRYGSQDPLLRYKMNTDPQGTRAALFENGRLIDDAHRFLKERGLHYISGDDVLVTRQGMKALAGKVVPEALYKDLVTVAPRLKVGVLEKAANLMAKSINFWAPVILNTPGFHIRNALFGQFQVFLAVGADIADPALWRAAGTVSSAAEKGGLSPGVIKYLGREYKVADLAEEARRLGVFEGGRVADLEGYVQRGMTPFRDQSSIDTLRRLNPFSQRGLITKEPLAKVAAGRGAGYALSLGAGTATAENVQRTMIYLHGKMKLGLPAREAAQNVVKYMFDYTGAHLSPGEKTIRRFLPFYQWVKQSLLLTLDQMLKNPRRYAQVDHLFKTAGSFTGAGTNTDPRLNPSFLLQQGAIPAPFIDGSPDQRTWLSTERPGVQASWVIDPVMRLDPGTLAAGVAQQLGPVPSTAVEIARGKYNFGDRALDENYVPEMSQPGTVRGAAERFFGMQAHNIPEYLMRKAVGGYPGLATDALLNLVDPELVGNNPRWTGLDERNRRIVRAMSMLFGPRVNQTRPPAAALHNARRLGTVIDKVHAQQQDRASRREGQ